MGVEPPFLYDHPSRYYFAGPTDKAFNPKAATEASWTPPPSRSKHDGPLIQFNKHPDSYLIVPYGNINAKPMSPNTKTKVKIFRRIQLLLRICALLGTLGTLFCIIAISNISGPNAWIIRVAPAVAVVHIIYAIYHLCRKAEARTPASTASYMLFAAIMDAGLIPFVAYSAIMAHIQYSGVFGWSTLFGTPSAAYKIIYSFFLLCVAQAGILVVSLVLDLYLATLFRKISKLPPDMNPLEPNLTARPHKRNQSQATVTEQPSSNYRKFNHTSETGKTAAESPIVPSRRIPFMHTRTDSAESVTLYGSESGAYSRVDLLNGRNKQPYEHGNKSLHDSGLPLQDHCRQSPNRLTHSTHSEIRSELSKDFQLMPRSPVNQNMVTRHSHSTPDQRPLSSSAGFSEGNWLSHADNEGDPVPLSMTATRALNQSVRPPSPISLGSSRNNSPDNHNNRHSDVYDWYGSRSFHQQTTSRDDQEYTPLPQEPMDAATPAIPAKHPNRPQDAEYSPKKRSREPLGMNPPTPMPGQYANDGSGGSFEQPQPSTPQYSQHGRVALLDVDVNTLSESHSEALRPAAFVGTGGKTRFYGNLRNSIRSNTSHRSREHESRSGDGRVDMSDTASNYSRAETLTTVVSGEGDGVVRAAGEGVYEAKEAYGGIQIIPEGEHLNSQAQGHEGAYRRNVSGSTGFDLQGGYAGLGAEFGRGMGRRRDVSGKVVEEGRATPTPTGSPMGAKVAEKAKGAGPGWARWKGL